MTQELEQGLTTYTLTADDVIDSVGGDWERFATDNDCRCLTPGQVLGRSLWDFVRDEDTRRLYESLLRKVRATGRPVSFPYRCDSPEEARHMEMRLEPLPSPSAQESGTGGGRVAFSNWTRKVEPRDPRLYHQAVLSSRKRFVFQCSICNKVRHSAHWREIEECLREEALMSGDERVQLCFAICDGCKESFRDRFGIGL